MSKARIIVAGHGAIGHLTLAGADPEPVSQTSESAWLAMQDDNVHGLLLLGGGDVNPALYTSETHRNVYGVNDARDRVESGLLQMARERGMPVMGICRGAQLMNVTAGGTLHLDIDSLPGTAHYHGGSIARVQASRGSRLARAWQNGNEPAQHIHHQAVKDVAPGYVATAFAHDGIIECIESVRGWEVGVQFHPEMSDAPHHQRLFNAFVRAAARFGRLPEPVTLERKPEPAYAALRASQGHAKRYDRWPVSRAWRCGLCNIVFDVQHDWTDHMAFIHTDEPVRVFANPKGVR